jgi:hypothetical protein
MHPTLIKRMLCIGLMVLAPTALAEDKADKEIWEVDPDFARMRPTAIAVAPMDNFSLEPGIEEALHNEVYQNLSAKGYARISADHVREVMNKLGIGIPALLAGISPQRLGRELKADAILMGQIEQSASIHSGVYDAVVVSTSLRLVDAKSGKVIWRTEQWRTAHRQWQIDPINLLLNMFAHAHASREGRIAYLVREMLKTLPQGPVMLQADDLFNQAVDISVTP